MKKKAAVHTAVFVAILLVIFAWFFGYYNRKSNDNLPSLSMIAEMGEAEANELLAGYRRIQLREVWREPDETDPYEDVWVINEETALLVCYNDSDKVSVCRFFVEE